MGILWRKSKKIRSRFHAFEELPREVKMLIAVNAILAFGTGISALFLNIYVWKQTDDIVQVVLFNLIQFPTVALVYLLIGTIRKRLQIRTLFTLGFISYILVYVLLLVLGDSASQYLYLLAYIFGVATGFYWAGNGAMVYLSTKDETRHKYFAVNTSISSLISIAAPLLATVIFIRENYFGLEILSNYNVLFAVASLIFLGGIMFTNKLSRKKVPKVEFKQILQPITSPLWRVVGTSVFIDGFRGGILGLITSIIIYEILTSEFNMGIYNTVIAILTAVVAYKMASVLNTTNRLKFGFVGAVLQAIATIILIGMFSHTGLIISAVITIFAAPLYSVGIASSFFKVIDHDTRVRGDFFKFITFREIILNLGRASGAILFLVFLTLGNELSIAKGWYLALGASPLVFVALTHFFEKTISQEVAYDHLMFLEEEDEEDEI